MQAMNQQGRLLTLAARYSPECPEKLHFPQSLRSFSPSWPVGNPLLGVCRASNAIAPMLDHSRLCLRLISQHGPAINSSPCMKERRKRDALQCTMAFSYRASSRAPNRLAKPGFVCFLSASLSCVLLHHGFEAARSFARDSASLGSGTIGSIPPTERRSGRLRGGNRVEKRREERLTDA